MFDWSPINLAKTPSGWTDKRIETLKELWAQGLSGSAIAAELGGVTRNSVIGKVHRLGLAKRANPTNARATPTRFRKPRVQRFREVLPMPIEPNSDDQRVVVGDTQKQEPSKHQCTIMDLTHETCRWPLWTDAAPERLYCGGASAGTYCGIHTRMAWRRR